MDIIAQCLRKKTLKVEQKEATRLRQFQFLKTQVVINPQFYLVPCDYLCKCIAVTSDNPFNSYSVFSFTLV